MDEPPVAEALLVEGGTVAAIGTREEVLARTGEEVPIIDIGQNVAYPGFISAHAPPLDRRPRVLRSLVS